MTTQTTCRRDSQRHSLGRSLRAWIELEDPAPTGRHLRFPLFDLSTCGFSFRTSERLPWLEPGARFDPVTLWIGECGIRGDILIMHVTPNSESGIVSGVLFYPANDDELLKLKGVVAGIEVARNV